MYKYLVVGCGGSGGETLTYMMDQLASELAPHGIDRLPRGWQFVHIDVPAANDTKVAGIGNVVSLGGTYIATAPQSATYSVLDGSVSQTLANKGALEHTATWAPRNPAAITVPIIAGAGQMRSIGRVITLSRLKTITDGLAAAVQRLNTVEAERDLIEVERRVPGVGKFDSSAPIVVLVVSSMAGGAGASMALDVTRLLSQIPGIDPDLTGVFMVAPDVFDSLPESARGGVRANALAMLGEIVATQLGSAEPHDVAVLNALGTQTTLGGKPPFARVFPVGRKVGAEQTLFGDGSQRAVYRGLGRGLAALVASEKASGDFVSYDLGNVSGQPPNLDYLGWGIDEDLVNRVPWGSFGFARLSMGRDRYRHYAAQRISRTSVDRLVDGHLQPGSTAAAVDQLARLVDSQWDSILAGLELPRPASGVLQPGEDQQWFQTQAFPQASAWNEARSVVEAAFQTLPDPQGVAAQWLDAAGRFLSNSRPGLQSGVEEVAYKWAFNWTQDLHQRILATVRLAIPRFGLPYARAVLDRLEKYLSEQLIPRLSDTSAQAAADPGVLPPQFLHQMQAVKGTIANGHALAGQLVELVTRAVYGNTLLRSAGFAQLTLNSLAREVFAPLRDIISDALQVLERAKAEPVAAVGLANVATDRYSAWPSDNDEEVPARFDVADNEILIEPSARFSGQYEADLRNAIVSDTGGVTFDHARLVAAASVISGEWEVSGGDRPPGGLLTTLVEWRPAVFNRDPNDNQPLTPSQGRYALTLATSELVDRALAFVARRGESFDNFCSLSLYDYVRGEDGVQSSALPARHQDLIDKFTQTLSRALPLISVEPNVVSTVHQSPMEYRFKFSDIPFADNPELARDLAQAISSRQNIGSDTADIFARAIKDDKIVTHVDVFGSYQNYSPLVFDALLAPVSQQWAGTPDHGRRAFWAHRRSRPLPASLPMSRTERQAMIAGWYVGQLTGQLRIPGEPFTDPVQIWDAENSRWLDFPFPMLTPPKDFVGQRFDWLPAVLESILIAIARGQEHPLLSSIRPYRVLRGLYDATSQGPATGLLTISADQILADWLRDGETKSGAPSSVTGSTLDERADAAVVWLDTISSFTVNTFVTSSTPGRSAPAIRNRSEASSTPIFRDLAPDIVEMTAKLREVVERARRRAEDGVGFGSATATDPGLGNF